MNNNSKRGISFSYTLTRYTARDFSNRPLALCKYPNNTKGVTEASLDLIRWREQRNTEQAFWKRQTLKFVTRYTEQDFSKRPLQSFSDNDYWTATSRIFLRHWLVKVCSLFDMDLVTLRVSGPCRITDFTLVVKICGLVLKDRDVKFRTGFRVSKACLALPTLLFTSSSAALSYMSTLPKYIKLRTSSSMYLVGYTISLASP